MVAGTDPQIAAIPDPMGEIVRNHPVGVGGAVARMDVPKVYVPNTGKDPPPWSRRQRATTSQTRCSAWWPGSWRRARERVEEATFTLRAWNRSRSGTKGGSRRDGAKGRGRRSRTLSVTVSAGIGGPSGKKEEGPEDVLNRADRALYRAKKAGRNRVAT